MLNRAFVDSSNQEPYLASRQRYLYSTAIHGGRILGPHEPYLLLVLAGLSPQLAVRS